MSGKNTTGYGKAGKKAFNADMQQHGQQADDIKADLMENKGKIPRNEAGKLSKVMEEYNRHAKRDKMTSDEFNKALDNRGIIEDPTAHKESLRSQTRDVELLFNLRDAVDDLEGLENRSSLNRDIDQTLLSGQQMKQKMQTQPLDPQITKDINGNNVLENVNKPGVYMTHDNGLVNLNSIAEAVAMPGGF